MADTPRQHSVHYSLARSWLLTSVLDEQRRSAAAESAADAVILDLEDGTPAGQKDQARAEAVDWLGTHSSWVRINGATTEHWRDDLRALRGVPGVAGVMLAESTTWREADRTATLLGGNTPVVALIESAAGLAAAEEIARVPGVRRLAFGVNDFRRDTGIGAGSLALAYPRSQLVIASRLASIAGPIDGPCAQADPAAVRAAAGITEEMGMTGQLALHPEQTPILNECLSPGVDEIAAAEELVAQLGEDGSRVTNGSDLPRLARAKKLLEHARDFGLVPAAEH